MSLPCLQRKTPNDGQRNCPKRVEFYSKNKFEKFVHLVVFIIRIFHDARSPERQKQNPSLFLGIKSSPTKCKTLLKSTSETHTHD